jgi:hypothetical protein
MIARVCSIIRMLLGIKTERERRLDHEFELARVVSNDSAEALHKARQKVEQARNDIHARVDSLEEQTGEFSVQQRQT